ncbi:MAG TPA: hypothetical protein VKE74_31505 [Gemmataceae bacterium]|nr:hypothetical protein [Gemmataceae bacterium]
MLCPRCHGMHVILVNGQRVPCPECQGMGEIHCCDGLTEQPDACELPRQPPGSESATSTEDTRG